MRFDETNSDCQVFTFKEGMLSAVAHDLKLRIGRFAIDVEGLEEGAPRQLSAWFDIGSLRVMCAMKHGLERYDTLSEGDKKKIEQSASDVLETGRFPRATFVSTGIDGSRLEGKLTLHGVERSLVVTVHEEGDRRVAQIEVNQPDHGIKPYTAALGTLRIRPVVRVRVAVPRSL